VFLKLFFGSVDLASLDLQGDRCMLQVVEIITYDSFQVPLT
jgi:hypothetical protein